jgi:hypothetical protein
MTVGADRLLRFVVAVKLWCMKRQLIAVILMLAIGLQGSMAAFAATSTVMSTDCQTTATSLPDASQDSCCPKGQRAMSCCLDLCLSNVAVTVSPPASEWYARSVAALPAQTSIFSSRGDSPLIRPPIL